MSQHEQGEMRIKEAHRVVQTSHKPPVSPGQEEKSCLHACMCVSMPACVSPCLHACSHLASFTHTYRLSGGTGWEPETMDLTKPFVPDTCSAVQPFTQPGGPSVFLYLFPHSFPKSVPGIVEGSLGKSHNNLKEPARPGNLQEQQSSKYS